MHEFLFEKYVKKYTFRNKIIFRKLKKLKEKSKMDELDLGTDLDYKDLGDNARKNDRTGMVQILNGLHPNYETTVLNLRLAISY